ncbi:MAG: 1-aminocyclopropane-1-carboxylate deaminase/D-cysteine desulfhydrase [Bacteroidia bacterium]
MPRIDLLNGFFGEQENNSLAVLRLDLPDPLSGGNKSYKLKYNLVEMQRQGLNKLLTFGGAFSNHIAAVATVGKKNDFETIGIIRGNELNAGSNDVLKYAASCGMKLFFVTRDEYKKRNDPDFIDSLQQRYGPAYVLPEGGSNELAVKGCMEILSRETDAYDVIICPVGTGATLAGIIAAAKPHQKIIGIAVLKGKGYLEREVNALLKNQPLAAEWEINHDFTFGGYANPHAALFEFDSKIKKKFKLPLEYVYSGKALLAMVKMKRGNAFIGKHPLFIHTGGYAFTDL